MWEQHNEFADKHQAAAESAWLQETELSAAQDADIDTDVELGLNVDMSEFEGDEEAEADALHDEENEELAQAAFELEQPDSQDADIDALVGSLDDDFEDLAEAEGQQGTGHPRLPRTCSSACISSLQL